MATHKIWYVPMMDSCGYASCKFFTSEKEMEDFIESFEESYGDEEQQPYGRQPGNEFEFEVTDSGNIEIKN